MINIPYILKNERLFRSCTGMNLAKFKELIPLFKKQYYAVRVKKSLEKDRQRQPGAGRKPLRFDNPTKVLFYILFFVRNYPTFDLAQMVFELDRANLHFWFHLGLEILEHTIKHKIELPATKTRKFKDLFKIIPDLEECIIDASEQPINRPKYNQKQYYSGKKKKHTIKRQFTCTPEGKLISISTSFSGKTHDNTIAEQLMIMINAPPDSLCLTDLGYLGMDTYNPTTKLLTPLKKHPNTELTESQKTTNKAISSIRVIGEHVIGHTKYYRIFSDKIRYRIDINDKIANVVGGLYNFKRNF